MTMNVRTPVRNSHSENAPDGRLMRAGPTIFQAMTLPSCASELIQVDTLGCVRCDVERESCSSCV